MKALDDQKDYSKDCLKYLTKDRSNDHTYKIPYYVMYSDQNAY